MRCFPLFLCVIAIGLCCSCGGDASPSQTGSQTSFVQNSSIAVTPSTVQVPAGGSLQFVASVTGLANTGVVWSINEGTTGGAIDSTGKYTAPMTMGTYHVTAQSQANATVSVTATVTVFQPGEPNGVYMGTYSFGMAFYAIILPDDMFYSIEGTIGADRGMIDVYRLGSGQGKSLNGSYTTDLAFFLVDEAFLSTLRAQYVPATSLAGSISNATFTANVLPTAQLDFNIPADLSHITGLWSGTFVEDMLTGEPAAGTLTISPSGKITSPECISGTITPDANKNFFTVALATVDGCSATKQAWSGVAVEMLLPDGISRQLLIVTRQSSLGFAARR